MTKVSMDNRVAYSPGEFAALFGKSQTWGYRQIYAGKVKAITEHGRILIPAKEVERILESAGVYSGRPETPSVKARRKKAEAARTDTWRKFVSDQVAVDEVAVKGAKRGPKGGGSPERKAVLDRFVARGKKQ